MSTLETAFAFIGVCQRSFAERLRTRMETPFRPYHNELHIVDVLDRVFEFSGKSPTPALVLAALYHDAIYDPAVKDNEAQSAEFCRSEMYGTGLAPEIVAQAIRLIELTRTHDPKPDDRDGILMCDADLSILASSPERYAAYSAAIRSEYAYVPDEPWRTGRAAVLNKFLERERIFRGDWEGVSAGEAQARANIGDELRSLRSPC